MAEQGGDTQRATEQPALNPRGPHGFLNAIVQAFLYSNLSLILILLAAAVGLAALLVTTREEDPQIIVPLADVFVDFPGHSAEEVEQLVATPLEKLLWHIDGVEYVYSMSRQNQAIITVRFYVGQDRERSLVKIYKKINENLDIVPLGVTGWVIKPVEIDDVPIVNLTLASATSDAHTLRRVGEEIVERLAAVPDVSRAYVVGGQSRIVYIRPDPGRLQAYSVSLAELHQAITAAHVTRTAGHFDRLDEVFQVDIGEAFARAAELNDLVVGVFDERPVFVKDVADVLDGPEEIASYVRHGWGPARGFAVHPRAAGNLMDASAPVNVDAGHCLPAVTIAIAKKKGTNAVRVAEAVLDRCAEYKRTVIPDEIDVVITRNNGLTADEKVNELVEALAVAVFFVLVVLTLGLGWREALIVALTVPVVFGLTLTVNLIAGLTINRVTLFALILSLGLLVDDPIVDVENITRHFVMRRRATRTIVLEAVAEIRPPLITATLAVIVSFLPMSFITGMMGPYMRPMALNVPIAMLMSMLVAFTITPWLTYTILKRRYGGAAGDAPDLAAVSDHEFVDSEAVRQSTLYRIFYPLMAPLMRSRPLAWTFLAVIGVLTVLAATLAATRHVPLKMLPFDNKNELLLVLDMDEGTTLERSDALAREMEGYLRTVPEVMDFTSYVGLASPMDFNGMVRHYYLRQGPHVADIRVTFVGKKNRAQQSHSIALRLRDPLTEIAERHGARMTIVETPPGPPVLSSVVAEVYGRPDHTYEDLVATARTVKARLAAEPGAVDLDDMVEADSTKLTFVADKEKAALNGVTVEDIARTLEMALGGEVVGLLRVPSERHPLKIEIRLPRNVRSSPADLARLYVKGRTGVLVPLAELGRIESSLVDKTIYHKNLRRVVYVLAETAGRPPADVVVDVQADRVRADHAVPAEASWIGSGWLGTNPPRPVAKRTFFSNGSGIPWAVPAGIEVDFAGEGEWKITLDVFRDLGLAFAAALVAIYILLVAQTRSFVIPIVVMLAIPLAVLGIMPGFWLLNQIAGGQVGAYSDPIFFTATGMIGMNALAGIVTRDAILLVDFIHLSLRRGRPLFDAIMESRVVRMRPILLTTITALFSALPITIDPIFSGLAWALIFGELASTLFTLFVIPITYWLLYANKPGHGLPIDAD